MCPFTSQSSCLVDFGTGSAVDSQKKKITATHFPLKSHVEFFGFRSTRERFQLFFFSFFFFLPEMQIQGQPPHYTNGISNNSETKWSRRFKTQEEWHGRETVARKRSSVKQSSPKEKGTCNYGSGQRVTSVGAPWHRQRRGE